MEKSYKTLSIVLKKREWRGADLLFSVYTREFGRIEAVATGVKKATSKLGGHLARPGVIELVFVRGKSFNKITHAYLVKEFKLIDPEDLFFLSAIFETVLAAFRGEERDYVMWEMLLGVLDTLLQTRNKEKRKFILNIFLIKVIGSIGYNLKLDHCVLCGDDFDEPYRFNFFERGFVCKKCARSELVMSANNFFLLKKIAENSGLRNFDILKRDNDELFIFLKKYLDFCLERKIKSLESI